MSEIQSGAWVAVATLSGNTTSRATSLIKQTSNSIVEEIASARGGQTSLALRLTNEMASAAMVASVVNSDGTVNTASIINSVNTSGDSSTCINADKIVMTGTTTFLKPNDLSAGGTTVIDGSRITTGYISADRIETGSISVDKLAAGTITANTVLIKDVNGQTLFNASGNIVTIGGFTVTKNSIYNVKSSLNSASAGVYIGTDGIALGYDTTFDTLKLFKVTTGGIMTCAAGTIGGWVINSDCLKSPADTLYLFSNGTGTATINNTELTNLIMCSGINTITSFGLTADGKIYCSDVNLQGIINATSGFVGGWCIDNNQLASSDYSVVLYANSNGSATINNVALTNLVICSGDIINNIPSFGLTTNGQIYCADVNLRGIIDATSGSVGSWVISNTQLASVSQSVILYANSDGVATINDVALTNLVIQGGNIAENVASFGLTADGKIYCSDVNLKGTFAVDAGYIGGWNLVNGSLDTDYNAANNRIVINSNTPSLDFYYERTANTGTNIGIRSACLGNQTVNILNTNYTYSGIQWSYIYDSITPVYHNLIYMGGFQGDTSTSEYKSAIIGSNKQYFFINNNVTSGTINITADSRILIAATSGQSITISKTALDNSVAWGIGSDIRLKENIQDITASSQFSLLQPCHYRLKASQTEHYGLIAQQVQQLYPDLINTNEDGFLSIRYTELIPILIAEVQHLQKQVNILSNK